MNNIQDKVRKGGFAIFGGQALKVGLQFIGLSLLARLLLPVDYGVIAMILALVSVGEALRDFGLSSATMQATSLSKNQRNNLFWINCFIGLLLTTIVFGASEIIAATYKLPALETVAKYISPIFLLNGISAQYRAGLYREMKYQGIAAIDIIAYACSLSLAVILAFFGAGYWSLVVQQLVQSSVALVGAVFVAKWFPGRPSTKTSMRQFVQFGSHMMLVQLIHQCSRSLNIGLIGGLWGPALAGIYDRALQLMMMPLNQISVPSTTLAIPLLSRLRNNQHEFNTSLRNAQSLLTHPLALLFALFSAHTELVIKVFLGSGWMNASPLLQILALAGTGQMLATPTYWAFMSQGMTRKLLACEFYGRFMIAGCAIAGAQINLHSMLLGYSLGCIFAWPAGLLFLSRNSNIDTFSLFLQGIRITSTYFIVVWAAKLIAEQIPISASAITMLSVALAFIGLLALFFCSTTYRTEVQRYLPKKFLYYPPKT